MRACVSVMRSMSYRVSIRTCLAADKGLDAAGNLAANRVAHVQSRDPPWCAGRTHHPKRVDVIEPRDQWATAGSVVEGNAGHEHTIEEAL